MAIPRGQFGNRLDTEAGRAKEAQMAAAAQALVVAHSEAVHGRSESAAAALQTAQQAASAISNAPTQFTQAVARDTGNIQNIISSIPTTPPRSNDPSGGNPPEPTIPSYSSYPSAPSSTPPSPYWLTERTVQPKTGIKQADPDIILDPEIDTSGDYIVERFFEELGGTELITLSRYDLIDGINVTYNPIANLSQLRRRFNPNNIIAIDFLSENEFTRTSIDLLSRGIHEPYFNDNGDLIIEVDIIRSEENIEAEISLSGTVSVIEL